MSKKWHQQNKIPKNSSLNQRIKWHLEHAKKCSSRPIPEKLKKEIKK